MLLVAARLRWIWIIIIIIHNLRWVQHRNLQIPQNQMETDLCTCICVFLFVYLYLCICICVFVFVYLYLCIFICVFVFVYFYLCIFICLSKKNSQRSDDLWQFASGQWRRSLVAVHILHQPKSGVLVSWTPPLAADVIWGRPLIDSLCILLN